MRWLVVLVLVPFACSFLEPIATPATAEARYNDALPDVAPDANSPADLQRIYASAEAAYRQFLEARGALVGGATTSDALDSATRNLDLWTSQLEDVLARGGP